jgi:hypothetical protein
MDFFKYTLNMPENQSVKFYKNPTFLLIIILAIFFLKGVFLASIFPIFSGQDEARHYNSMQYITWPKASVKETIKREHPAGKEDINDYNYSEEIRKTGTLSGYDVIRHKLFDTINFSRNFDGYSEPEITSKQWKAMNYYYPPNTAGSSLYHKLGAKIEKFFQQDSILTRFYSIRIFSVLLGTLAIFLAYHIAKNIGLSSKISLILTAIIAFQPKFSAYTSNINYDALLIPAFFLFTLGGVLSLKNGFNWKNLSLMVFAAIIGLRTKGTAIVLLAMLFLLIAYRVIELAKAKKINARIAMICTGLALAGILFFIDHYFLSLFSFKLNVSEIFPSLINYLSESLTPGRVSLATRTYWGILSWHDGILENYFVNIVWVITAAASIGITFFLFSKRKFEFLPEKKYIYFLLGMIVALQLGIRFYDWKIFSSTGNFDLGTPGRYFLPNLASHIILLFVGLGALMRKEKYFHYSLITGLILMFSFSMYLMFNVIIPRYYL